jgi:hypothetical protein
MWRRSARITFWRNERKGWERDMRKWGEEEGEMWGRNDVKEGGNCAYIVIVAGGVFDCWVIG